MKAHTNNYKENIKLFGRQITSKITFGNTTLGDEELNSITPIFQGSLLKSCMKELDINSNVNIPVGTILRYQFGVLVGNEYEYKPNYLCDEAGIPYSHAPGNIGDIEIFNNTWKIFYTVLILKNVIS